MTISLGRFLTPEEYEQANDEAVARGWYRDDPRMLTPGTGWYEPWYFDPQRDSSLNRNLDPYCIFAKREDDRSNFLSTHYWDTHSRSRPPIAVMTPNGEVWEIDRKSSNGSGWIVSGSWPRITCAPSIVVEGYHGFLQNGQFTADVDRPDQPNGVRRRGLPGDVRKT